SPSPDVIICNVDAAWKVSTRNCGVGCVFSGPRHVPKLDFFSDSHRSVSTALMVEALAIRSTVMYAATSNVKALLIRSESLSLVKMLKKGSSTPALYGILFDIYHFRSTFIAVSFEYVPRLNNVLADYVAKSVILLLNSSSSHGM
ncbi:unnamed protein product, partial [Brassica rapa]